MTWRAPPSIDRIRRCRHRGDAKVGGPRPPSSGAGRCRYRETDKERETCGDGGAVTSELLKRARDGDGDAFRELTEPYRRGNRGHRFPGPGTVQAARAPP